YLRSFKPLAEKGEVSKIATLEFGERSKVLEVPPFPAAAKRLGVNAPAIVVQEERPVLSRQREADLLLVSTHRLFARRGDTWLEDHMPAAAAAARAADPAHPRRIESGSLALQGANDLPFLFRGGGRPAGFPAALRPCALGAEVGAARVAAVVEPVGI